MTARVRCPCGWSCTADAAPSTDSIMSKNSRLFRHLLGRDGRVVWDASTGKQRCTLVLGPLSREAHACPWTRRLRSGLSPAPCRAILFHGIGHNDRITKDIVPLVPPVASVVQRSRCFLCRALFDIVSSTKDHVGAQARAKCRVPLCGKCKTFTELRNNNKISAYSKGFRDEFCDADSLQLYVPKRLNACLTCNLDKAHRAYAFQARRAALTRHSKHLQLAGRYIIYALLWQLSNEVTVYVCRGSAHSSTPVSLRCHLLSNYVHVS